MKKENRLKIIFKIVTVIITMLLIIFILYGLKIGIFEDREILVNYIKKFGLFAPIFFLFLQAVQVVFPVIPGGASCLAGVLAFGPIMGFVYNYIGLTIGSIIAFLLSRKYGLNLIEKLFTKETTSKYLKYLETNKFDTIFFWGILLPGLPDDLLCYIAGLSKMNIKKFSIIILLGKPLTLIFYSIFIKLL